MLPNNVRITSARYANAENTLVYVLLDDGNTWFVIPNNGSGQANVLAAWVSDGGNIGPYIPPVPGGTVPAGSLIWWSSTLVPLGYLLCDGSQVSRQQYAKLFKTIGTTFGAGDGQRTFNLPDLRGKMVRGWGPVNSSDPGRIFGSSQGNLIGSHRHPITDGGHTHGVTDPSHVHGVNDPGHNHVGDDPGHTHPVTDPGHEHGIRMYEIGYLLTSIGTNNTCITPDLNWTPNYEAYNPRPIDKASAGLTVNQASANISAAEANANVSDQIGFTGITVNPAVTNITETDSQGGFRTVPANLSLIPYIKY